MEITLMIQYRNFCSLLHRWVRVAILYSKEYNSSHYLLLTLLIEKPMNFTYVIFNSQTYFSYPISVSCCLKLLTYLLYLF